VRAEPPLRQRPQTSQAPPLRPFPSHGQVRQEVCQPPPICPHPLIPLTPRSAQAALLTGPRHRAPPSLRMPGARNILPPFRSGQSLHLGCTPMRLRTASRLCGCRGGPTDGAPPLLFAAVPSAWAMPLRAIPRTLFVCMLGVQEG
jgi:hypothetical protein